MNVEKYQASAGKLVRNPNDPIALVDHYASISERKENARFYLPLARRAYEVAPREVAPLFNYASALHRAGHFPEALKRYQECRVVAGADPDWIGRILHHIGLAYRSLGENKQAAEFYWKGWEHDQNPQYLKDRSLAILAQGKLKDGLEAMEVRREVAQRKLAENGGELVSQQKLPDGVVHWQSEDLTGKAVVVYHEEGQGDFIQFCRFIPLLKQRGAKSVHLCGPVPDLLDLVADNIEVDGIVPLSGPFECDYVIGSMSLPWRCGVELDQVNGRPYFKAEAAEFPLRGKVNVGLVWRGNSAYGMDVHRSMAFSELCPLFDLPNVAFYGLQCGPPALEVTQLGMDGFIANLEPFATSWRETATLVQRLDAVVTVDTAVAHLAGALGKPVYIMVTNACDWRWNRNNRRTVWYDSARVIRQRKQDDWEPCITAIRDDLRKMSNDRRQVA